MNKRFHDNRREPQVRINERIRYPEVRVIDENNQQLGIMGSKQAYYTAKERGLDLVEITANAQPPVCRIIDYGKFKYEQEKRERDTKKKHHQMDVKVVQLRPGTEEHDLIVKIKNVQRFLTDGDKVKVSLRFRSREITHPEFAHKAMQRIMAESEHLCIVERMPLIDGRLMIMVLAPKPHTEKSGGNKENAKNENVQNSSEKIQDNGNG